MNRPPGLTLVLAIVALGAACGDRGPVSPASTTNEAALAPAGSPTAAASAPASAASPTTGVTATATASAQGQPRFDGARGLEHIRKLSQEIGVRVAGSAAEQRTADYVRGEFQASGYDVEVEEFSFEGDPFRPSTIGTGSIVETGFAMAGSPGARVSGAAVFVGLADMAGVGGRDLSGKIAVAERGITRFAEKAATVKAAGAAGLVIINNADGDLLGNVTGTTVPVVGVTRLAGASLRKAADGGEAITVETPDARVTKSVNVIARPPGGAKCLVVAGGHHDTVPGAPGAHDNASGTAETIELARAFAADGLDAGLCFVTFGAEESGLHGSEAFVKVLQDRGQLPKVMVNLDTTGTGTRIDLIGNPEITRQALAVAQALGVDAEIVELDAQFGSDHQSFANAGVPVIFFATNDFSTIHTARDTLDKINADLYAKGGAVAYEVIAQLLRQFAQPPVRS